jgi:hypothetical protein
LSSGERIGTFNGKLEAMGYIKEENFSIFSLIGIGQSG